MTKSKQKLKKISTFELCLNESVTGFAAPPSTTDSTMYYDRTLSLLDGIY
nr:MAG TPA_asm: hypothetical protein [Bacteriophage sp.]